MTLLDISFTGAYLDLKLVYTVRVSVIIAA